MSLLISSVLGTVQKGIGSCIKYEYEIVTVYVFTILNLPHIMVLSVEKSAVLLLFYYLITLSITTVSP